MIIIARPNLEYSSKVRPPVSQALGRNLICNGIRLGVNGVVCATQIHAARYGVQVAALDDVQNQVRMSLTQLVPEFQQTFHVPDLGNALAIARIRLGPERGGTEVAVLTENVDSFFGNQIRHEIGHCLSCYRVAEVEQPPLDKWPFNIPSEFTSVFSDKPFWMFDGERGTDNRPFRLKPKQILHALGVYCIAYRSHAIWMRDPVDAPVPSVQEPILFPEYLEFSHRSIRAVPSCIHPEGLEAEVLFRYLIDQVQAGRGLRSTPRYVGYRQNDWFP